MRKIVAAASFRGKSTKNRKICNCSAVWNSLKVSLRDLSKVVFEKESYYTLFSVLKDDDDYVKTYTLLEKMAKFVV